jgi:dihydrofolate reductase
MRKLTSNTFLTLDGVMQAPGGPEEDRSDGFMHGGWSAGYWDEEMGRTMGEFMGKPFDLLLGRRTYEIFAAYWPHAGDQPGADALNRARKYVASRTLDRLDWQPSELLERDVVKSVKELKQGDGPELQVHGSANLLQTLLKTDLLDEIQLMIFPIVLGSGKRLFEQGVTPTGFELVESKTSSTGVIISRFKRSGAIRYGSFAHEQPTEDETKRREKVKAESR